MKQNMKPFRKGRLYVHPVKGVSHPQISVSITTPLNRPIPPS